MFSYVYMKTDANKPLRNIGMLNNKWISAKEVKEEGLYLFMSKGDLEGNSTLTYIMNIDNVMYVNSWRSTDNPSLRQKLICPKTNNMLFYGPIPKVK